MFKYVLSALCMLLTVSTASAQDIWSAANGVWKGQMKVQSDSCGFNSYPVENFRHSLTASGRYAPTVYNTDQNGYWSACYTSSCVSFSGGSWNFRTVGSGYTRINASTVALQAYEYTGVRNNRANVRRITVYYEVNRAGRMTGQNCQVVYAGTGRR